MFVLDLVAVEGQPAFKPTFQECDDVVSVGGRGGAVFVLDLVVVEGKPAFKPTFQKCDDVVSVGGGGGCVYAGPGGG